MQPIELVERIVRSASDKKAGDIAVLDLRSLTLVTDYFVICDGRNQRQVQAIARGIEEDLREADQRVDHIEGFDPARWVLLDYGSAVVHVFLEEEREFYNLERLWGDAPRLKPEQVAQQG